MDQRWEFILKFMQDQEQRGLRRRLNPLEAVEAGSWVNIGGRRLLNLASNDYLGLRADPRLAQAAAEAAGRWGVGSGASRLLSGTTELHERVERKLASFHGSQAALTFSSGYAAGLGVIQALAGRKDRIYLDRLCHACLYDGAKLSGARLARYRHNDPGHVEDLLARDSSRKGRALVVTDTVFSMDGDRAPLAALAAACEKFGAILLADEAHAVGVLGPGGRGLAAEEGLAEQGILVMGTLGKALGVSGAYVACTRAVRDYLVNTCRAFIYSTAPPPMLLAAVEKALEIAEGAGPERARLLQMAESLRVRLRQGGLDTRASSTQIVPAVTGEVDRALALSRRLLELGIYAPAIRPPTVPQGAARVRFSLTAALSEKDSSWLLESLAGVIKS